MTSGVITKLMQKTNKQKNIWFENTCLHTWSRTLCLYPSSEYSEIQVVPSNCCVHNIWGQQKAIDCSVVLRFPRTWNYRFMGLWFEPGRRFKHALIPSNGLNTAIKLKSPKKSSGWHKTISSIESYSRPNKWMKYNRSATVLKYMHISFHIDIK